MPLTVTDSFVLASKSPRRVELLQQMGIPVEVMPADVDETFLLDETPGKHALRLSEIKAETIAVFRPESWVLGADTIVVIDEEILGKPTDSSEAGVMLRKLSDRLHEVFTGFTIINKKRKIKVGEAVRSQVRFKKLSEEEIRWYIETPEPYDKAGGYAVQGLGAFFIREIHGSYTNVMGLPLCEVAEATQKIGALNFS